MQLSDETLVRDIQEGNISAFEELVRRYQNKLHRFVVRIVSDSHAAEDVVQETFINVYTSIERVDPSKKFTSYIYSIARNRAISHLRSRKAHVPLEVAEGIAAMEPPDSDLDVMGALDAIDKKYKRVISLYYFKDLSYEEISKILKVPLNTVRTHLKRAKEALRKQLI